MLSSFEWVGVFMLNWGILEVVVGFAFPGSFWTTLVVDSCGRLASGAVCSLVWLRSECVFSWGHEFGLEQVSGKVFGMLGQLGFSLGMF